MDARKPADSRLVYSTDGGRVPRTAVHNRAVEAKGRVAPPKPGSPPDDGVVRIQRDRKGRGGKTMTAVTGLPGDEPTLDGLLKQLKAALGTGGSRDGRTLLFQGDHRER